MDLKKAAVKKKLHIFPIYSSSRHEKCSKHFFSCFSVLETNGETHAFFQTSGPSLPIPLYTHSMVSLGKGQAIIGGLSSNVNQAKIYSMTCSNRNCIISLLDRELSMSLEYFVAIPIPDRISGCITGGRNIFQKNLKNIYMYKQTFVSPLKYRLPVPNTDRGWFLPRLQQQSPLFF